MFISILLITLSPYTAFLPLLYTTYKVFSKKMRIDWNPWNIGLLLLLAWSFFSGIVNQSAISCAISIVIAFYFCFSVYLQSFFKDEAKIEAALKYLVYFSIFSAIIGVIEKIVFTYSRCNLWKYLLGITTTNTPNHRIYSTFGNPNVAGTWFAAMILIIIYLNHKTTIKEKLLYNLSILLFVITLYMTGSRGAVIGLIFGLVVNYFCKKSKANRWYFISLLALLAYIIFSPFQLFNIRNLMYREISRSFTDRFEIWKGCLEMIQVKPIQGWSLMGVFDHGQEFIVTKLHLFHGHNLWIALSTALGIVGLLIYLYMKLHIYRGIMTLYRNNCKLVRILASIQALVIGQGIVDFTIMTPQAGILFISSSAIICALYSKYKVKSS